MKLYKNQKGQTLVILLVYMVMAIIVTTAAVSMVLVNSRGADKLLQGTTAYDVAESGAETAMVKLLRDTSYAGETLSVAGGTAVITVSGTSTKTIVSKGTLNNFTRSVEVTATNVNNVLTVTSWKEL